MELKVFRIKEKLFTAGPSDELLRLDRVIFRRNLIPSMKFTKMLIEAGGILVNDRIVNFPSKKIQEGDKIFIRNILFAFFDKKDNAPEIICEDENIIVINKPSGFLSPEEKDSGGPLKDFLTAHTEEVFPVHRLDRETSGVMVFAKNKKSAEFLKKEFKERRVKKSYLAILNGVLNKEKGIIKGIMKATGEYGESEFFVKERHKWTTFVEIHPKTGRTNQIRIQFSEMGYPLVGEKKYLINSKKKCVIFPRLALHTFSLSFAHPQSLKTHSFSVPLPSELVALLELLRSSD